MISRHMISLTSTICPHMPDRDTLDICEEFHYPVVSGHTGFIEINNG